MPSELAVLLGLLLADLALCLGLAVVAGRLGAPRDALARSADVVIPVMAACLAFGVGIWSLAAEEQAAIGAMCSVSAIGDLAVGRYAVAGRDKELRPGYGFFSRLLLSLAGMGAASAYADGALAWAVAIMGLVPRVVLLLYFAHESQINSQDPRVDEVGILCNRVDLQSDFYMRMDISHVDPGLAADSLPAPSFIGDFEDNSAAPTRASSSSSSLPSHTSSHNVGWGGDDAAGPSPGRQFAAPDLKQIPRVEVVSWREIMSGNVPLVVFVLKYGRNIVVHRFGEFHALANRQVNRAFLELGAEPPMFPERRTFRKLLPVVVGGTTRGSEADREFYSARASQLENWLGAVISFFQHESASRAAQQALVSFLTPLDVVEEPAAARPFAPLSAPASQELLTEQAVDRALKRFSRILNGHIAPPSP